MLNINAKLKKLEEDGKRIRVGVIGAGQMGKSLVCQMFCIKGMRPTVLVNRTLSKAKNAYIAAGVHHDDIIETNSVSKAQRAMENDKYIISENIDVATSNIHLDAVVDATGSPEVGAQIALKSIQNGKHIIMLNVEADVVVGPILKKMADSAGVVYTVSAGDEPGAIKELYDFADAMGFEIIACGKGKNNPLDRSATPESLQEKARAQNVNPRLLTSFVDGTNTMIEMNSVSNATGFLPSTRGMMGITADLSDLPKIFSFKDEGGILERGKILEYVHGIAPGVFVIIRTEKTVTKDILKYLSMGDGPSYVIYRPYHLTSFETPLSIAKAYFYNEATLAPQGQISETLTIAKKDLKAGQYLDHIGGNTVYGLIDSYKQARKENAFPIGLVSSKIRIKRDIKKDEIITYDDICPDYDSLAFQLRKIQEKMLS